MIRRLFSLAALILLAAACTNSIDKENSPLMRAGDSPVFYATIEGDNEAGTKVYADEKMRVLWNADDRITIFNKETYGKQYRFTGNDGANAGGFKVVDSDDDFTMSNPLDYVYAVYPYAPENDINYDGILTLDLPAEQTYKENSFGVRANTMVSVSSGTSLKFRNVGGYLSFKLYGEGVFVKSITLKGNNNEKLAGKAKITMPVDGLPTAVMQNTATDAITLSCETPVALGATEEDYTEFWFVVPPITFEKGFTLVVTDSENRQMEKVTNKSLTITRSSLHRMAAIDFVGTVVSSTLKEVREAISDNQESVTLGGNLIVQGTVISNSALGNQPAKNLVIQDNTAGIAIYCTNAANYEFGDVLTVDLSYATLQRYNNYLEVLDISNAKIKKVGHEDTVEAKEVSADDFLKNKYESQYVAIKNVQVVDEDLNKTWVVGNVGTQIGMEFTNGSVFYVFSRPNAVFGSETVPQGSGTIKGIATRYNDALQLCFAQASDWAGLTNERFEPSPDHIVFADPAAKYACVAKFDTDGDGQVSFEEAEAATTFNGLFTNWKGVKSFDEIRYFKNVHSISGVFDGCDQLVSITVPESITSLGSSAFSGCSSLTSVDLPSGITAIGNSTFKNCSSLGSVVIPANVISIGTYAFSGCSSLTAIDLPSGVTSIAEGAFQNCTSLGSFAIPSSVSSVGPSAFSGCSSLSAIKLPPGVTSIAKSTFENCKSLTSVSIPDGVTSVGNFAFYGVKMWKLELPSSITSLGSNCFNGIVCIILPSTSPVTIQSDTFDGVLGIFVPSKMMEMYGVMTNWAKYISILHPISTYKDKSEFTLATSGVVDMGTSVKWAAYNVGATKPEEYGDNYAWGETEPKSNYEWRTYKWASNKLTKYCPVNMTDYWDGEGVPDGKTVLDLEDDAARANWGGNWRMPTDEEWTELREGCLWEWTTYEGINGYKVYGIGGGNIIFLPAAGYWDDDYRLRAGSWGFYWSSSLDTGNPHYAYFVAFKSNGVYCWHDFWRCYGFSVRPVTE